MAAATERPLHILVLVDRDWTHPQAGGTGENLLAHVRHWVAWGHRVTILAGEHPGAPRTERDGPVTVHRRGGRKSVFAHTLLRVHRGIARDADVVLEIVNGIAYLTPLWLRRRPTVQYVHHVHREQYIEELGARGRLAAFVAETAPLRWLYRRGRFVTVSRATAAQLTALGIPEEAIEVNYHGPDPDVFGPGRRAGTPTLLYLGRLKRYKRIEVLLDIVEALPGVRLEIAGRGDHEQALREEIAARGLEDRVRLHGFVDDATRLRLLQEAWALVTASSAEGWGLTTLEAAACGTPTVAVAISGLAEAVVHDRTGLLADDTDGMIAHVRRLVEDPALRERLGDAALERARALGWEHTVRRTLAVLEERRLAAADRELPATAPAPARGGS